MAAQTARRLLLVDDDPLTITWLRALFEKEGYRVETAANGREALERFQASPPDVMILDRVLPDMDGTELCRKVRAAPNGNYPRIIFFTVKGKPEEIVESLNAGADDYIIKARGADAQLATKIKLLLARAPRDAQPVAEGKGKIISFFSAKGGSGVTTIAVNTAYSLHQARPQASMLLADMVFPLGSIGRSIGFDCPDTLAKLSHSVKDGVTPETIARFISAKRPLGISVLLNTRDMSEAQNIEVSQIEPIFKTLRGMFDMIVIDFGRSLSRLTLPVLESSDLIFVIVPPDINGVGLTRVSLDYFAEHRIPVNRIAIIQNRTIHRSFMSREEMEKELGQPIPITIPFDGEQVPLSTNARIPYMAQYGGTATSMALESIARLALDRLKL